MESKRIVMNYNKRGSEDGFGIRVFNAGSVYDTRADGEYGIADTLACHFLKTGAAHIQTWEEWRKNLMGYHTNNLTIEGIQA